MDTKDYPGAEQYLKEALAYFETDAARAPKIREELVNVYVAWGDSQVAINNIDGAVKYYQQAADMSQGAVDANLLIAKAYLKQALEIADKSDFNRALTKVSEVESTAQADNVKAEVATTRDAILEKYSESNSMQAADQITAVIPLVCNGQRPELPIFGVDKNAVRTALFTTIIMPLPKELTAGTPGQLHYVTCVEEIEKEIQTCGPYVPGNGTLYRLRYDWAVTVYNVATGDILNSQTFSGGDPPACKKKELFNKGVKVKKSYGSKPTVDQVAEWLMGLGIFK
jgi:tetratricopeptide (TPR) repeat protein